MHNATVLILLINDYLYSVFLMLENEYIPIVMVNPNTITVMHPVWVACVHHVQLMVP